MRGAQAASTHSERVTRKITRSFGDTPKHLQTKCSLAGIQLRKCLWNMDRSDRWTFLWRGGGAPNKTSFLCIQCVLQETCMG